MNRFITTKNEVTASGHVTGAGCSSVRECVDFIIISEQIKNQSRLFTDRTPASTAAIEPKLPGPMTAVVLWYGDSEWVITRIR